jgi:hypothetical protein
VIKVRIAHNPNDVPHMIDEMAKQTAGTTVNK